MPHFFDSLSRAGRLAIHLDGHGGDDHHLLEAAFKSLALALRQAVAPRPAAGGGAAQHQGRDMTAVTLIDYGAGNLRSLRAAFERLGCAVSVSGDADQVAAAGRLVLPGRGRRRTGDGGASPSAGSTGRSRTHRHRCWACAWACSCCSSAAHEGDVACLGLLPGQVVPIDWAERVPHMGWNDVIGDGRPAVCYFAHSYAVSCDPAVTAARTPIDGREVPTVVRSGRLSGVQFHPEKSAADGRRMLEGWLAA